MTMVNIAELRCVKCGYREWYPFNPVTEAHARELAETATHSADWPHKPFCGGRIAVLSEPAPAQDGSVL
jgi:hypothetical protein